MSIPSYFATCARGLEKVLAEELRNLEAREVRPDRGGVYFSGDNTLLYQANLWVRTAVRILKPILEAPVHSPEELYEAVRSLNWQQWMTVDHTLAVDCNVRDSAITHSRYAALKTKDAICDWWVDRVGRRPNVDVHQPMIPLNLHIFANRAVLSLDSSGESLHKRGYRSALHRASLNEALAAGLIQLTGWKPDRPFIDPLCGSGTFSIEAGWMSLERPPGLTRKRFAFQSWLDFDVGSWAEIRDQARKKMKNQLDAPIVGLDNRRDVLTLAQNNARAAGCGHLLKFEKGELADFLPPPGKPGVILCNPPYGERIGEEKDLIPLYRLLGKIFAERCQGWQTFIFTGNGKLARQLRLPVQDRIHLFNGRLPCQLLHFSP